MSMPDYPCWEDLIDNLMKACNYMQPIDDGVTLAAVAGRIKARDPDAYWQALRGQFMRQEHPRSVHRYHLLARISFASYVTTNFDPLLLDTLHLHRNVVHSEYSWLPSGRHGNQELFFIHGRIDPEQPAGTQPKIVLTEAEYEDAYDASRSKLSAFLQDTLTENHVCFLGCGLNDECLKRVFRICKYIRQSIWGLDKPNPPQWFAVVDEDHKLPTDFESECGIRIVKYPRSEFQFDGLDQLLQHFARVERPRMRKATERRADTFLADQEVRR